ncbi:MAG: Shikimate kinase [Verrucomicrobia bacterium ADurb.Bin345]|nr:MAG: Shikimate kinase [Verrucomicrobia bacterium ADurb.Bin345]
MDGKSNIVLVGFMGTGKSATAKLAARQLGREFVDMDATIEERAGRSISEIFRTDGESVFREIERSLVKELAARRELVIAAGGGVVLNPDNISDFKSTGVVICLNAAPSVILQRVRGNAGRPLLESGDKAQRILELLETRRPLYGAIPFQLDTTYLTPEGAASNVVELFRHAVLQVE